MAKKKLSSIKGASTEASPTPERLKESSGVSNAIDIEIDRTLLVIGDENSPEKNITIAIMKKPFRGKHIVSMRFGEEAKDGKKYFTLESAISGAKIVYNHWLQGQKDIKINEA